MNIKFIAITLVLVSFVILSVTTYAIFLIYITWPISNLTIANAGAFGHSFGIITSLFSGLAFIGIIITILLQREELQLQRRELTENRKEFAKSADAQERSAQLSALSSLLNECDEQIKKNESSLDDSLYFEKNPPQGKEFILEDIGLLKNNIQSLNDRKAAIMNRIEEILNRTGIDFN